MCWLVLARCAYRMLIELLESSLSSQVTIMSNASAHANTPCSFMLMLMLKYCVYDWKVVLNKLKRIPTTKPMQRQLSGDCFKQPELKFRFPTVVTFHFQPCKLTFLTSNFQGCLKRILNVNAAKHLYKTSYLEQGTVDKHVKSSNPQK